MQLDLTEEQRLLEDSAVRFLGKFYGFEDRHHSLASPGGCRPEIWAHFADMGWLALPFPEDAGGFGGGALETGLLARAMGRHLVVEPFLPCIILAGGVLARHAHHADAVAALTTMMEGGERTALAFQEPAAAPVKADADDQGGWRLTGRKPLAAGAATAGRLLITACLPDGGRGLFLLPATAPGLTICAAACLDGTHAADITLDSTPAAAGVLLGRASDDTTLLSLDLDAVRLAACWETVGAMRAALEQTVDYVKQRQQFGRPIAAFQAVQHKLAEMSVCCEEAEAITILASLRSGGPAGSRAGMAAKAKVGRCARLVAKEAVQLHGGMGVSEELPIASYFRKLLAFDLSHGGTAAANEAYAAAILPGGGHMHSAVLPPPDQGVTA
ncbi:acyl-CoA dehydrogenase family protein [Niveispirillum fermenti]|uniref:acyl-CoA dehydrogenase family protein n=1 Tax=Niveispirillum fermenti TaxID=1233113 RepID=UPI003A87C860